MTGDCAIVAKVTSFTFSGNNNGKAGLMIRDNLSATVSQRSWIGILPAATNYMESRSDGWTETWGGSNWSRRSQPLPPGMPYWLKLERRGNMINSYTSQDGTSWAAQLCSYYGNLPSTVYIGLFVCSGTATAQTATFANVSFTGGTGGIVTAPAAPAAVIATASSNSVTVRWLPSFGATSYMVLRSTSPTGSFSTVASNLSATTTSYVDTTAAASTSYYYAVRAINSAGNATSAAFGASHSLIKPLNYIAVDTANDSANNPSNAASALDQDPWTQWFYTGTTGWLQYDLGANNARVVNRYTVTEANTIAARDPKDWQFQGSQDGTNWTTLDTQSNQSFDYLYQRKDYDIGNTTGYRYYRLNVTANNGDSTFLHVGDFGLWSATAGPAPGTYKLRCRTNGIMLDSWGRTVNGSDCAIYLTDSGHVNQTWTLSYISSNVVKLRAVGGGLYLDGMGRTANGSICGLYRDGGSNNQRWTLIDVGGGYYKLKNVGTNICLDIGASPWANGDSVEQWGEGGSTNQQWQFVAP
jgi:regulation of enolase protein 1 (concanavalin A-like superfamily)